MSARITSPLTALAMVFTLLACGDDGPAGPAPVANVSVAISDASLVVGDTAALSVTVTAADGSSLSGRVVTYTSSDPGVARATSDGRVIAVGPGSAQITATSEGRSGSVQVTVVPRPVASLSVTPATLSLTVGASAQLTAVARSARGDTLVGRTITWASTTPGVATVDPSGRVTAVGAGSALIIATADGASDTVAVSVAPASTPTVSITNVDPATLEEGGAAVISGSGFSPVPAENIVTVAGERATVVAASETLLRITVPGVCVPEGPASVQVTARGASATASARYRPAAVIALEVGRQIIRQNAGSFCLQLPAGTGPTAYLVGVQSVSEIPTDLTPVRVRGRSGGGTAHRAPLPAPARSVSEGSTRLPALPDRWARHRAAEQRLRAAEREVVSVRAPAPSIRRHAIGPQALPASVQVGDTIPIRVPSVTGNSCTGFTAITTVVQQVGQRGVFLEDVMNPPGGFSREDYAELSRQFDQKIYPTDVEYFGEPTDFDDNGRIGIVVTKVVNEAAGLLGFVASADLVARTTCASSDEGEFYYGKAPDPNGTFGGAYTVDDALEDAPKLIAHEFTHIIQFGRRIASPTAQTFLTTWEAEGQATLAEEVNGHEFTGRQPRQNYGFDVAFNEPVVEPIFWYNAPFVDLAFYYGFQSRETRVDGAPEECTWITREDALNGPCLSRRLVYGVPWSLLRWISDHFGPGFPGGEQALQRRIIDNDIAGFASLEQIVGEPIETLLAQWAAMLYVDDRIGSAETRLRLPSWNLFDIYRNLVETARLQPEELPLGDFTHETRVRAASSAYLRVSGQSPGATAVRVTTQDGSALPSYIQVWVVRLQ